MWSLNFEKQNTVHLILMALLEEIDPPAQLCEQE